MGKKATTRQGTVPDTMWERLADAYRRIVTGWAWVIPALTGLIGVISSVFTTRVFLALWAGLAVFAALTVVTLLLRGVRIPAGWSAAIILIPFIGEVGVMSYLLLMLAAGAYIALFAVYFLLAAIAWVARRRGRRTVPVAA